MPQHAHAVPASTLPYESHDRAHERLERPRYGLLPALRQGPTLRKLLGPSACDLWGKLQRRAFRSPERMVVCTLHELTGARGSDRTTSWCLRRLVAARVIDKVKTRTGLAIRVLAFDRDEWGNGEISPYLSHETIRWMHGRRPRGRPRKEPMHAPEPAPKPRRAPPAPPPADAADKLAVLEKNPVVPPDPTRRVHGVPRRPRPPQLDPSARPSTHREILIALYVSAVRWYWPRASLSREVKFLRTKGGMKLLTLAADSFIAQRLPPAIWVRDQLDRISDRKTPMRPEILFSCERIDQYGEAAVESLGQELLHASMPDSSPEWRVIYQGRHDLTEIWKNTMRALCALPDVTDADAVARTVQATFPSGWELVYMHADLKLREIQNLLNQRAELGEFLWGPRRG